MRRTLLLVAVSAICVPSVRADLLPPGQKPVEHLLRIENIKEYPDHVFFIYPRDLNRGQPGNTSVRVGDNGEGTMAGNPLARRAGVFLYAVPRTLADKVKTPSEEWFEKPANGVLKSALPVGPIRTVAEKDPRKRIVTRYQIEIKDGLKLMLLKDEKKEGASAGETRGSIAVGFALCAVFTGAGLIWARSRQSKINGKM